MRTVAVVVAAGKGKRFKNKIPKQYININGKPLLCYTLSVFNLSNEIDGIILVTAGERIDYCRRLVKKFNLNKVFSIIKGGEVRADSVYNGLKEVSDSAEIIVVHDGVRPFVKKELIKKVVDAAEKYGAAICGVKPKNTVKEISGNSFVKKTLMRSGLTEVQTPQAFRYEILKKCYERFKNKFGNVTDDSALVEMAGYRVKVVEGDYDNIKITTNEDLKDVLVGASNIPRMRVGVGYDIHRLVKGRKLVLGGVNIPGMFGLLGHSDADVLLHAITDAILGAIGERDIGWHFSNKDPRYKGIVSSFFLKEAYKIIKKKGYKIRNIDSIIVAQEPKLQPYYKDMTRNISGWLDVPAGCVTVKFTTPEEVGPLGHKKAIAGMAIAAIVNEQKIYDI